jgi:hypothetical protein
MKFSISLILWLIALNSQSLIAQEEKSQDHAASEHEEFKHHYIGLSIGHTHISSGVSNGETTWLALPSFGFSYVYAFNPKWAIGLHNEMIVEDFVVESSGSQSNAVRSGSEEEISGIRRGRPIAVAVVGVYKIHKHIGLFAGGGMEFSEHEDFALVKIGAEFPYHFAPGWEMFGTLSADLKIDAYNSFSFGFGVARLF